MVTVVPPAVPPLVGVTEVTVAFRAGSYVNAPSNDAEAPPVNVTVTSQAAAGAAARKREQ